MLTFLDVFRQENAGPAKRTLVIKKHPWELPVTPRVYYKEIICNTYIYTCEKQRARYRERCASSRIPRGCHRDHPGIQHLEHKNHVLSHQNTNFELALTFFLRFSKMLTLLTVLRQETFRIRKIYNMYICV